MHRLFVWAVQTGGSIYAAGAGTSVQLNDCELEDNRAQRMVMPRNRMKPGVLHFFVALGHQA